MEQAAANLKKVPFLVFSLSFAIAQILGQAAGTTPVQVLSLLESESLTSHVSLQVRAELESLRRELGEIIPNPITTIDERVEGACFDLIFVGEVCLQLNGRVWPNGTLELAASERVLVVELPVTAVVTASAVTTDGASIGTETATASARLTLQITPELQEDWRIIASIEQSYVWLDTPGGELLNSIPYSFASLVDPELDRLLEDLASKAEGALATDTSLRDSAAEAWAALQEDLPLYEDPPISLAVRPTRVYMGALESTPTALLTNVAVELATQINIGRRSASPDPRPLPNLMLDEPPTSGFAIYLPVVIDHMEVADWANRTYAGNAIPLGREGTFDELTLKNFSLSPSGDQITVGAEFTAHARTGFLHPSGALSITGRPVFDVNTQELSFNDLSFSFETNNPLARAAISLSRGRILREMQDALVYNAGDVLEDARAEAEAFINQTVGEQHTLTGNVDEVTFDRIVVGRDELFVVTRATGDLLLTMFTLVQP